MPEMGPRRRARQTIVHPGPFGSLASSSNKKRNELIDLESEPASASTSSTTKASSSNKKRKAEQLSDIGEDNANPHSGRKAK
jgi:hypothetical protein